MKVLIACEFSGTVREAFKKRGHDAWSCDLLPTEIEGQHYQGDVFDIINDGWDLMIAHPPCTYLTVSGNKWMKPEFKDRFPDRENQRKEAIEFFKKLYNSNIDKICIENPVGVVSTAFMKPTQYIQPYFFGHPEPKKTGLWLKNLPSLIPTKIVEPEYITGKRDGKKYSRIHYMSVQNVDRWKLRSKTFQGVADAMAEQWGSQL
jgi:hypothetical protein